MTHITVYINDSSKDFDDITLPEDKDEERVIKLKRIGIDAVLLKASRDFCNKAKGE